MIINEGFQEIVYNFIYLEKFIKNSKFLKINKS